MRLTLRPQCKDSCSHTYSTFGFRPFNCSNRNIKLNRLYEITFISPANRRVCTAILCVCKNIIHTRNHLGF